tara:strand:- start:21 stop:497 length:477 start_codon:yes stop_codon:yes gene_type:complete
LNYFLNVVITFLILVILGFAWSFNMYLKQEKPVININQTNTTELNNKIKLFENYSSQTISVAVLNGCGVSGVGNSFGNLLSKNYGLKISRIENADNFDYELTTIVILSENNNEIDNLLTLLGTNTNAGNVQFDTQMNPNEDIQIIIGKDYQDFLNFNK